MISKVINVLLIPGVLCASYAGCNSTPTVASIAMRDLPLIDELTSNATGDCEFVRFNSPHSIRVCAIGRVDSMAALNELFPFLSESEIVPGADSLNIPDVLSPSAQPFFVESDPFWMLEVKSRKYDRSFAVSVGFSSHNHRYYVEYSCDQ